MTPLHSLTSLGAALLLAGVAGAQVAPAAASPKAQPSSGPNISFQTAGSVLPDRTALQGRLNGTRSTIEDFESYVLSSPGGAENIGVLILDDTTIANGQGPGLVEDGCTYSCNGNSLQWNDASYFGLPSKDFLANTIDGQLFLTYSPPVTSVGFDMYAFSGFPDTTTVTVYDGGGTPIFTSSPISVPGPSAVFFGYTAGSIGSVRIASSSYPWSTIIDDHEYGGGLTLSVNGTCPGPMMAAVDGATAGGSVAFVRAFGTGSVVIPGGHPCAGTMLGLSPPLTLVAVVTANGSGHAAIGGNVPPAACGHIFVQAVDIATCTPTNVVGL